METFETATAKIEAYYDSIGMIKRADNWEPSTLGLGIPKPGWLMTFGDPKGNRDQHTVWLSPDCDQYNVIHWDYFECLDIP
jgi:hypothetical protein